MGIKTSFMALVLAAVTSLGCFVPAYSPKVTMSVDAQFSLEERKCIEDSAAQWKEQTNGLSDVRFVYDYNSKVFESVVAHKLTHRVTRWTTETPMVKALTDEGYILLGQVSEVDSIISGGLVKPAEMRLVADRLEDPNVCRLTAIHELGHLMGINHIKWNEHAIMFPSVRRDRKACLKNDDLIMFCAANDCGNVPMKPCEDSEDNFPAVQLKLPENLRLNPYEGSFLWQI